MGNSNPSEHKEPSEAARTTPKEAVTGESEDVEKLLGTNSVPVLDSGGKPSWMGRLLGYRELE